MIVFRYFLLGLLLLAPSISKAATVSFSGTCYASEADARTAFLSLYPLVDTTSIPPRLLQITTSALAGSTLTYTMTSKPLNSATITTYAAQTITFPACTTVWMSVQSVMILAVGFLCTVLGFLFAKWRW